jgi:acetylornithine/N-succinyldiaminopimelate aminotransferase
MRTLVLKIGGRVAAEPEGVRSLACELAQLAGQARVVLVHGGGAQVTELSRRLGLDPTFQDGVRDTSAEEMVVADMVLAGSVSTELVRRLQAGGVRAVGVSGADGGTVVGRPLDARTRTGAVVQVRTELLDVLLSSGYVPVLSSVATDAEGGGLNINADDVAIAVAAALRCDGLLFVSDVPGVLRGGTVLGALAVEEAAREIVAGTISGGMLPKVRACVDAIGRGIPRVVISDYQEMGDLGRMANGAKGTTIHAGNGTSKAGSRRLVKEPPLPKCFSREMLVLDHGEGVWLVDVDGRRYLDFAGGVAVNALGYGRADLAEVASRQMRKLIHVSNLFATEPALALAAALTKTGPFAAVQFQNSGTEANEAALKYARLYAMRRKGPGNHHLLSFTGSFHGRTFGALSVTPTPKYQDPFAPLVPGTAVCPYNDVAALEATLDGRFAGVIVEVIQGEGGLECMTPDFAQALKRLCRQHDVILIADEVQTGLSRTGTLYASETVGLEPDIITLAKPLAAGLPLSAVLLPAKVNDLIHEGEHGTTFSGGPVTTAVALKVWETLGDPDFIRGVQERGKRLGELLEALASRHPGLGRVKGRGLLRGIEVTAESLKGSSLGVVPGLVLAAREAGLLILRSGTNVLRVAPPLVVSVAELQQGVGLLETVIEQHL